ncbi:hypothetical protein [Schlesneria paludicola]|uniref:hypothetical protein n=1 Tax=Schlesneria paludicola TaxID=360056 RepID=UPI00029A1645|nr:hypothetical protein [Schlesneria paludicola]
MSGKSHSFAAFVLIVSAGVLLSADPASPVGDTPNATQPSPRPTHEPSHLKPRIPSGRNPRVLIIVAKDNPQCELQLNRLRKPGGDFETMRSIGWKIGPESSNHIQIIDQTEVPDLIPLLNVREFPAIACVADGEIIRSFKDGCTTPLDAWTFGWLIKGTNERPKPAIPEAIRVETTGHYRLRGNHWSLEGDPNPTKQTVLGHLRGPNHGHASASYGDIESWSYEELRSLHDDLHEQEGGTVGVNYGSSQPPAANRSLDAFSGNRKALGKL